MTSLTEYYKEALFEKRVLIHWMTVTCISNRKIKLQI